jgi:hypothetical protein
MLGDSWPAYREAGGDLVDRGGAVAARKSFKMPIKLLG